MTPSKSPFQVPITSVPDEFVHSTGDRISSSATAGRVMLPMTRARAGVATGYASQVAVKRLSRAEYVLVAHTTACPFPVRNGVSQACGTSCDHTTRLAPMRSGSARCSSVCIKVASADSPGLSAPRKAGRDRCLSTVRQPLSTLARR
jgi:hypothetical protein